jgi:hypothetical protein
MVTLKLPTTIRIRTGIGMRPTTRLMVVMPKNLPVNTLAGRTFMLRPLRYPIVINVHLI